MTRALSIAILDLFLSQRFSLFNYGASHVWLASGIFQGWGERDRDRGTGRGGRRTRETEGLHYADLDLMRNPPREESPEPVRTRSHDPPTEYASIRLYWSSGLFWNKAQILCAVHLLILVMVDSDCYNFYRRWNDFEGFRPEWYISSVYHCRDIPFWSETLDLFSSFVKGFFLLFFILAKHRSCVFCGKLKQSMDGV